MCMPLKIYVIFIILTEFTLVLTSNSPGEGTGQKAHFSLQDTPGSFTVHANKMLAKVSSKADSIKVIVKPGMAEFPVPQLPTQKPLVHVASPAIVRPIGGWNFMSLGRRKRSTVEYGKESSLRSNGEDGNRIHFAKNLLKRAGIHSGRSTVRKSIVKPEEPGKTRLIIEKERKGNSLKSCGTVGENHKKFGRDFFKRLGRKTTVRKSLVKPEKGNRHTRFKNIDSNINIAKRFRQANGIHRRLDIHWNSKKFKHVKGNVRSGQKRASVERNMKVKGGAGKFSVHVDKKLANVSSSTGGVEIFIKNPSPKQMSQLPREMLQLPGTMLQLPNGMSQLYKGIPQLAGQVSQFPTRISQLPKEKPWALVRLPYDWTGASNWDDDTNDK